MWSPPTSVNSLACQWETLFKPEMYHHDRVRRRPVVDFSVHPPDAVGIVSCPLSLKEANMRESPGHCPQHWWVPVLGPLQTLIPFLLGVLKSGDQWDMSINADPQHSHSAPAYHFHRTLTCPSLEAYSIWPLLIFYKSPATGLLFCLAGLVSKMPGP